MYDIVIIGSGPAGLTAGIYAKRAGKSAIVIEKDYEGAGQITLGGHVDNYPGFLGASGMEIGEAIRKHAVDLGVTIINATVKNIEKNDDYFLITSDKPSEDTDGIKAKNVVLATGAYHRTLGVKGEEELTGMGVSYCATCDGALYRGASVVVAGGGDTAIDDAIYLSDIAEHVTLVHRRDSFRAAPSSVEKLRNKENVTIITGVNITEILGDDEVTGIVLDNGSQIEAEGVFVAVGMIPRTELVEKFGVLDNNGYVTASEDGATSVQGLYAAGDVRAKFLRQVVTAVSDGANCINTILQKAE